MKAAVKLRSFTLGGGSYAHRERGACWGFQSPSAREQVSDGAGGMALPLPERPKRLPLKTVIREGGNRDLVMGF